MLGQHPDLYGFPELALFVADTIAGLLDFHQAHQNGLWTAAPCSPGLLRALAQLEYGSQTPETVDQALHWVEARRNRTTRDVADYLLGRVRPRIGIDKSPLTAIFPEFMARDVAYYPHARILHLTRHPETCQASMRQQYTARLMRVYSDWDGAAVAGFFARIWCASHRAILGLTGRLPAPQTLRVRGEDILLEPDYHLARIAHWLGVRDDVEALQAMKHPERSPYASFGPGMARGANDPKFLAAPKLRPIDPPPPLSLPSVWRLGQQLEAEITKLAEQLQYEPSHACLSRAA
jgi:hypothetical protein